MKNLTKKSEITSKNLKEEDCNYKGARIGYSNTEKSYFIGSWFNSPVELFQTISDLKFGFN